jgi:lipopolysaccharide/colanic/teichoic acid biosynthesis glycosyltransferase
VEDGVRSSINRSQAGIIFVGGPDLMKRFFDIFASAIGLLLLSPLFIYVALLIRRDSPGSVFYRGSRAGRGGKTFEMLKFRTMYERPESYAGPPVTAQDDARVTPVGRWLRDTKLNEFPQLWNVLQGQMSLVGPRPEAPDIVATWPKEMRDEILSVRPGITSPASVLYRNEETLLSSDRVMETYLEEILPSKLRLDQLYARHHSFWGDLDVLFWTALVLVPRMYDYTPDEGRLYNGPIWQFMRRYVNWFTIDTVITFIAIAIAGVLWRTFGPLDVGLLPSVGLAALFALLFGLAGTLFGTHRITWSKATPDDVFDLLPGAALVTLIALLANYLNAMFITWNLSGEAGNMSVGQVQPEPLLPVGLILTAAGLAFLGFVLVRYRSRLLTGLATRWVAWRNFDPAGREKALLVGGGESGQIAAWMLNNGNYAKVLRVVGLVDDDMFKQGIRIHGLKVMGRRVDIPRLVSTLDIGVIIFAIHNISADERREVLKICASTQARLFIFPDIMASLSGVIGKPLNEQLAINLSEEQLADSQSWQLYPVEGLQLSADEWLAHLSELVDCGDLATIRAEVAQMRLQIKREADALAAMSSASGNCNL